MRASFVSLGLALILLATAPVSAQESIQVPTYPSFMKVCLSSVVSDPNDREAVGFAGVLCHCTYEQVADRQSMTKSVFAGAMRACGDAAKRDPDGFTRTFVPRVREAMRYYER